MVSNTQDVQEDFEPKGVKYLAAKKTLPVNLHAEFDKMVTDYAFYSFKHSGRKWVAYNVLADLVRAGWCIKDS
jgi:hypothetical protein